MKKKGLPYPESVILEGAKLIRNSAMQYVADLGKFGIDMPWISTFSQEIAAAELLRNQDANTLQLKGKTADKNAALTAGFIWVDEMGVRVTNTFKKDSPEYLEFPFQMLEEARRSERHLKPVLENAIDYGQKYALQLVGAGHSPEIQADGQTKLDALTDKDDVQEEKKHTNKQDTELRHEKFDNLVKKTNKITATAKKALRNKPDALILFESPWPKQKRKQTPPAPPEQ